MLITCSLLIVKSVWKEWHTKSFSETEGIVLLAKSPLIKRSTCYLSSMWDEHRTFTNYQKGGLYCFTGQSSPEKAWEGGQGFELSAGKMALAFSSWKCPTRPWLRGCMTWESTDTVKKEATPLEHKVHDCDLSLVRLETVPLWVQSQLLLTALSAVHAPCCRSATVCEGCCVRTLGEGGVSDITWGTLCHTKVHTASCEQKWGKRRDFSGLQRSAQTCKTEAYLIFF